MSSLSRDNPSFSSSLLDEIYRSIDEQSTVTARKKQTKFGVSKSHRNCCFEDDDERRASLIQKWMENKKPVVGRRSAADHGRSSMRYERGEAFCLNSSSCYDGVVSLSENESAYGVLVRPKPRPIRTGHDEIKIINRDKQRQEDSDRKSNHEGKFVKAKSKALKIYSDLKQPISPGGRLSSFLNSLFSTGNNKKPNTAEGGYRDVTRDRKSKSANASTCSSASRSCLSNTSSSCRGGKRTVRFYPVDEDYQHKHKQESQNSINKEVRFNQSNRHISEAARNLLNKYQKKVIKREFDSTRSIYNEYEEQSDDSDSSSDLFELHNLSTIGMHKYGEELPVYETTQLNTHR